MEKRDSHTDIKPKSGWWKIDFRRKNIYIDKELLNSLFFFSDRFTIAHFLGYVVPKEKEHIGIALDNYPHTHSFDFQVNLRIDNWNYLVEMTLDNPEIKDDIAYKSSGNVKVIRRTNQEEELSYTEVNQMRPSQIDTETELRKINLRLSIACKIGLIYPWTWYVKENCADFNIFENKRIVKKGLYFDGFAKSIHPEDSEIYYRELNAFKENKIQNIQIQYRSNFFSEEYRWYEMNGEIFEKDESGGCTKVVGVLHDITDSKNTEESLKENELQLIREKEKAEKAVWERKIVLDNLNTALIYINNEYVVQWESTKALGPVFYNRAYVPGTVCYKTVFRNDSPCKTCALTEMFECGKSVNHLYTEHGVSVEITANPVLNEKGEFIGGVLKIENVTKRILRENQIKRLNTLMDAILNNIPVYLFMKDPNDNFRYLYWNKAMEENTKIPASKVLGKTDIEIFPNEINAIKFKGDDLELLKSGDKLTVVEEYDTAEDKTRIVNTFKVLVPNDKELPWILGISWDITDMKKAEKELIIAKEKAEESNRLKSAFLANMSHEIRTPLNAIVGFSELLAHTTELTEKEEYIDIIKKNNELLLQLISDILDLSKIEAQSLEFIYQMVDVNNLLTDIVSINNLRPEAKVPVILDNYKDECYIYSDKNRVNQVLSNLIHNSLKFTITGNIKIGYHLIAGDTKIRFYVKDTGTGIPNDKIETIFDRFIKLDSFKQGSGLGLSICKSIVEQLNGNMGVESEPGKGSCFWFSLPYDKNLIKEKNDTKDKPAVIRSVNNSGKKASILIAEDIDSNYLLVEKVLIKDYNLTRARNGEEAIELYTNNQPDLILMDIKMPVMNGLEAVRNIRLTDKNTPIIALTAFAYDIDIQNAKEAGCNDFLTKPISIHSLTGMISKFIK